MAIGIEHAALHLFVQRGYRTVTIGEIASAAGVSRRTFFRYFREKYDVLLADSRRREQLVISEMQLRSYERSTFAALCQSMLAAAHFDRPDLPTVQLRSRLVTSNPELLDRLLSDTEQMGEQLSQLTADRLGIDRRHDCRADLVVRLVRSATQTALRRWWLDECESDLADLMSDTFELLQGRLLDEIVELDVEARRRSNPRRGTAQPSPRRQTRKRV